MTRNRTPPSGSCSESFRLARKLRQTPGDGVIEVVGHLIQVPVVDTTAQTPWGDYEPILEHVRAVPGVYPHGAI